MLKKSLLALGVLSFAMPTLAADLTNPFYMPSYASVSSVTSLGYEKTQFRTLQNNNRAYRKNLTEDVAIGLTDNIALLGSIGNVWDKSNYGGAFRKENTNIDFTVGAKWNLLTYNLFNLQIHGVYGQRESWADVPRHGTYKYISGGIKGGLDLNAFMPYASANMEVPVFQKHGIHNENIYELKLGGYKMLQNDFAIDAGLRYTLHKDWDAKMWHMDAEVSYYITPNIATGVYGSYLIKGDMRHDQKAHGQTVGLRLRTSF